MLFSALNSKFTDMIFNVAEDYLVPFSAQVESFAFIVQWVFISFCIIQYLFPAVSLREKDWTWKCGRWVFAISILLVNQIALIGVRFLIYYFAQTTNTDAFSVAGFFEAHPEWEWVRWILMLVVVDGVFYVHHIAYHYFPRISPIHLVHHLDTRVDLTTNFRVHPIEIIGYNILVSICVLWFRPTALEFMSAFLLGHSFSIFVHSNFRLPTKIENTLGLVFMTSGHHRRHHERIADSHDACNYGLIFTFLDRIFGTYRHPNPAENYQFGIDGYSPENNSFADFFLLRFRRSEN